MTKQSFIGNMWKAAVKIKSLYAEGDDFYDVEIVDYYIDKKFVYLVVEQDNVVNNGVMYSLDSVALSNMSNVCEGIEKKFEVECKYFIYKQYYTVFQGFIIR